VIDGLDQLPNVAEVSLERFPYRVPGLKLRGARAANRAISLVNLRRLGAGVEQTRNLLLEDRVLGEIEKYGRQDHRNVRGPDTAQCPESAFRRPHVEHVREIVFLRRQFRGVHQAGVQTEPPERAHGLWDAYRRPAFRASFARIDTERNAPVCRGLAA